MPLLLLADLVGLVLVLEVPDHGFLPFLELQLVLEHELAVGLLLHGPEVLLLLFHFLRVPGFSHLLGLLCFYLVNLLLSESFKVVRKEPVLSQPVFGCLSGFCHEVRSGGVGDFLGVLVLLPSSKGCFFIFLGLSLGI